MSERRSPFDTPHYVWFWSVIESLRVAPESAEVIFHEMSVEQLEEFYNIYRAVSVELYPEYRDEERGWYEDGIAIASNWVVNQGQAYYRVVFSDLSTFPDPETVPYDSLAGWAGWAASEYSDRLGKDIGR